MPPAVLTFFGGLLGAGIGTAIVTWWLETHSEHRRWLRDRKLEASNEFFMVIKAMSGEMLKLQPGSALPADFIDRITASEQSQMELISPPPVIDAAKAIAESLTSWCLLVPRGSEEEIQRAFAHFRDCIVDYTVAVRADLGADSMDNPKPRRWFKRN